MLAPCREPPAAGCAATAAGDHLPAMGHAAAHHSITAISRGAGRSATAAVAYAAGELVPDDRTGLAHDYRRKGGVVDAWVVGYPDRPPGPDAPPELPAEKIGRLANAMEASERRRDACVARATILALPAELPPDRRRALAHGYALWLRDTYGVASVVAIHEPDRRSPQNHHCHLVETTRRVDAATGDLGAKVRELDDRKTGRIEVERRRVEWQRRVNAELDKHLGAGVGERVDARSHRRRAEAGDGPPGILPVAHAGPARTARARKADANLAGFWRTAPMTPADAHAMRRQLGDILPHEHEASARQEHNAVLTEGWSLMRRAEARERARQAADRLEQEAAKVAAEQRAAAVAAPETAAAGAGARVDVRPVLDAVAALPGADLAAIRPAVSQTPGEGRRPPVGGRAAAVADDPADRARAHQQELAERGRQAARRQAIEAAERARKRQRTGREPEGR